MPANTAPVFGLTPKSGVASISTANPNRDGTGTLGTICTVGAEGRRINAIRIKARVTTTSGLVRFFITDGADANPRLIREVSVSAITVSATAQSFDSEWKNTDGTAIVILQSGYKLKVSTERAEAFDVAETDAFDY